MKARHMLTVIMLMAMAAGLNAQEHKTYTGQFGRENGGTATYSYYEGADGRRMFDGKYTYNKNYKREGVSATYTETGQYKDDKLDGLWTITFNQKSSETVTINVKMNYKDGVLHGPMTFVKKVIEYGKVKENINITMQFHEGYLTGKGSNVKLRDKIVTYEFDENNLSNGLWKCKVDDNKWQMIDCVRYEHGTLKMSYHENITTGDREGVRYEGNAEILEVVDPLLEGIDNLLAQPYDFKEMPIRSGLKGKDVGFHPHVVTGSKFGFLGFRGLK